MCILYLFTFVSILLFVEIFTALASKQTCHKMLGDYMVSLVLKYLRF